MTQFAIGQPVSTDAPRVTVDAGLEPGRHRFGLVIVGSAGSTSAAAEALVTVSAVAGPLVPLGPAPPLGRIGLPARNEESPE